MPEPDPGVVAAVRALRDPATIRARCRNIADAVAAGASPHFTIVRPRLAEAADRTAELTRARFPDLSTIPYHSRWRHFEAGGIDRKAQLDALLVHRDTADIARARIDLTLASVLLDAGAGPGWKYRDVDGYHQVRSEGLAVATFRAFVAGRFSSDPDDPLCVDARALTALTVEDLAAIFQASDANPLVGLEGRVVLMHRLGRALRDQPERFGDDGRPGRLFDALAPGSRALPASDILGLLLDAFSGIWPSGQSLDGVPVGDVWPHPHAGGEGRGAGYVPFHKLSQWLSYSLLEPFEWAGVRVDALDALTGLPEYRNGGLLIDAGVLVPRDRATLGRAMTPADPWIVEWRALTVALLDELAPLVRERLRVGADAMPLACILEGGTWGAGRAIAAEHRPGGVPPVSVVSDGTVF